MTEASQAALEKIEKHRTSIDELDEKIVALLNERAAHSLAIRALKPSAGMQVYDPDREERIMKRLVEMSDGPMQEQDIRKLYATLLEVMKEVRA